MESGTSRGALRAIIERASMRYDDCVLTEELRQRAADAILMGNESIQSLRQICADGGDHCESRESYDDMAQRAARVLLDGANVAASQSDTVYDDSAHHATQMLLDGPDEAASQSDTITIRKAAHTDTLLEFERADLRSSARRTWREWLTRHPLVLLVALQVVMLASGAIAVLMGANTRGEGARDALAAVIMHPRTAAHIRSQPNARFQTNGSRSG